MIISQSANVLQQSFSDLWYAVVQFIPSILAAVIIFIIGWIVGVVLYRVVDQVVKILRIDDALKAAGLNEMAREAGFNLNIGAFLGTLVQWFTVIVFLVAALDVLGLNQVTIFLQQVVLLYLLPGAIVGGRGRKFAAASPRAAGAKTGELAGSVAKWAICVFAIMAI